MRCSFGESLHTKQENQGHRHVLKRCISGPPRIKTNTGAGFGQIRKDLAVSMSSVCVSEQEVHDKRNVRKRGRRGHAGPVLQRPDRLA